MAPRLARSALVAAALGGCASPSRTVASLSDGATHVADAGHEDVTVPQEASAPRGDAAVTVAPSTITPTFTFESGPVRPVALSEDGTTLYVANTSNGSLDIFTVTTTGVSAVASVPVGVDPVAVAARTSTEVWVVNQVSDSVSVVDTSTTPPHVTRTLLVGDDPSDIVFGGTGTARETRAFITTAHRGQHRSDPSIASVPGAGDPQLTTARVARADVWVFDATNLGVTVGGTPVAIVTLFGDTPRGLAVTPDGSTVYAAIYKSGNQSMATSSLLPCPGFNSATTTTSCVVEDVIVPGSPPGPATNYSGIPAPAVGVILKVDANGVWRDILGRDWTAATAFTLPDEDVFALDTTTLATTATYLHVGTTLFNVAVNPVSGNVYVSNTEARNDLRFEGPGTFAGATIQGHLAESRITVIDGTNVTPRYLNKHIDYSLLPAPSGTATRSLATPLNIAVSADGATLYVSAFGSSKIGVLPVASLEDDSFDPVTASAGYLNVTGGGPSGIVIDEARGRLYVATRFDDGLSVVDLATGAETSHVLLANPEPAAVTSGRPFLYDATISSSNGEAACASCHQFGDDDHLVWDLGNPDGDPVVTPINVKLPAGAPSTINGTGMVSSLHPMKGPMATQTLRGTVNHGPMHWRGDRVAGFFGTDTSTAPPYDSTLAFKNFILAFNSLLGRSSQFSTADMQTFADFALAIAMPPNAVRALDRSLTASQAAGRAYFFGCAGIDSSTGDPVACNDAGATNTLSPGDAGHLADGIPGYGFTCNGCHVLDPSKGFFGTDGESSYENLPQVFKVPHLRNLYEKVGMFGEPGVLDSNAENNGPMGPAVRGVGFLSDGSTDTLFRFLQATVFNPSLDGGVGFARGDDQRRDVEQWLLAFDGDLAPIVGQQVTLRSDNGVAAGPRVDLLLARAVTPFVSKLAGPGATECDLVARATVLGRATSFRVQASGMFQPDDGSAALSDAALRALATTPGQEVTYTCLPPGWSR